MLHGFNQSCHSWDEFCPRACEEHNIIALDQRGHGQSYIPEDGNYSTEAMVEDVHQIVTKLELPTFILVGMSMGARNSSLFSVKYPHLVKLLVLIDWAPEVQEDGIAKIVSTLNIEWPSFDAAVDSISKFNPTRTRQNIEERLKHTIHQLPSGKWSWKIDRKAWSKHYQKRETEKDIQGRWDTLKKITQPTLLLKGQISDVLSHENAQKMVGIMKNCQLVVVEKAGHSVAGDNPDMFYQSVVNFIKSFKSKL